MSTLYLPGVGNVDLDVYRVHQAVNEYDERLSFKRNEETGQYCVFIQTPRPHGKHNPPEIPVLGFGEVPSTDEAIRRLYETDGLRHGVDTILNKIDRHNAELKREGKRQYDDALGGTAEHMEFFLRKEGQSPIVKSVRKLDPKQQTS